MEDIQAAEAFAGRVAEYARTEGLAPKELHRWKKILTCRGLLLGKKVGFDFVPVVTPAAAAGLSLVLPNGVRLEFHRELGSEQMNALVTAASRLS